MRRLLLAGMLAMLWQVSCQAQSTIVLARLAEFPDQHVGGEILRTVYGRLGIKVEFSDLPGARALALSGSGALDGEVHRVAGITADHPALIQLSTAINAIEPAVFTTGLDFAVRGWESLRGYQIGIVRGVGSSEAGTRGLPNVERATSLETLIRMLDVGRIDLFVADAFSGLVKVKQMGLQDRVRVLSPPLVRIDIYHYLHRRHAELAKRVEAVLVEMQASGELAQLRERLIHSILASVAMLPSAAASD